MVSGEFDICNRRGLHARAAARFVNLASSFASRVIVRCGEEEVDGKSILSLMVLGAGLGTRVIVEAEGPDETAAVERLGALIGGRFDEED